MSVQLSQRTNNINSNKTESKTVNINEPFYEEITPKNKTQENTPELSPNEEEQETHRDINLNENYIIRIRK